MTGRSVRPRFALDGGTAVVTGAASGIGERLAAHLAARGSDLALVDVDAAGLEALARGLRTLHPERAVTAHACDLADPADLDRAAREVRAAHPRIRLLVNNAGVALAGRFEELDPEDVDAVLDVNLRAPMRLVHHLLPELRASGGHVVNVSSLFGLVAPAGQTAYAASKFALRGFSEALRAELLGTGVGVTTVFPGGVRTAIAANARLGARVDAAEADAGREAFERLLTIPADRAAEQIVAAIERRAPRLLIGSSARLPDALARAVPGRHPEVFRGAGRLVAALDRRRGSAGGGARDDEAALGEGETYVEAAGTRVRVRVAGDPQAPPVVLVHGIGRSLEDWDEQLDRLAARHRVLAVDLPGFGLSRPLRVTASLVGFAEAVVAVLDAVGETRPVDLVGNSLGGAVTLHVLALHPDRVRTLTLVDSAGFGGEVIMAMRLLAVPGLGRRYLARPTPASVRRAERSLYVDREIVTPERLDHALRVARNPGRVGTYLDIANELGTIRGIRPEWRRRLLRAVARHPRPTLVVWGDRDVILPFAHYEAALEAIPHARGHVFAGAGHLPQVERPEEFARVVEAFWDEADTGA